MYIGVPEEEEKEHSTEKVFEEIIANNFPSLIKDIHLQIQEVQLIPDRINPKENPRQNKPKDLGYILHNQTAEN